MNRLKNTFNVALWFYRNYRGFDTHKDGTKVYVAANGTSLIEIYSDGSKRPRTPTILELTIRARYA